MALRRNSFLLGLIAAVTCAAMPALADDSTITGREPDGKNYYLDDNYIYDYMGHQDSITTGLGDAPTSNLVIQHPTPWPSYINNTNIKTPSQVGLTALNNMMESLASGGASSSGDTAASAGSSTGLMPTTSITSGATGN